MRERVDILTGYEHQTAMLEQASPVAELFVRLPVENRNQLAWLSPLVPEGVDQEVQRQKVEDRYLDLLNLRKDLGFAGPLIVTPDVAIAILDEKLFGEFKNEIRDQGRTLKTARHEVGHAAVASLLDFKVTSVTVVSGAGYLGLTVAVPNKNLEPQEWLIKSAAISFGGALAASMMKDPVLGTGADMASAQAKAQIAVAYGFYSSEAVFLSVAKNLAHSALQNFGLSNIERQAQQLLSRGTIVS